VPGAISVQCSALALPDPLHYDTAPIRAAVLKFGPTEILPPMGATSPHHAGLSRPLLVPPRTPAGKARLSEVGGRNPARDRLSAGGRWIRNLWYGGTRAGHFRASRASRVARSTTAPRSRRACMRLPDARTHPGLSEWSDHLIWSWTKYRSVASDVMPSAVPGNEDALPVAAREVELEGSGPR
jgi:hypothetical protein